MDLICKEKIRILCIEDNPIDVRILERSLEKAGVDHQLDEASCLEAGLEKLRNSEFDVVFSDLGLPGAFGIEVVQSLREDFPSAPLVVLTALEDEQVVMQALDSGAQDYLAKSEIQHADLRRIIRHAMLRHQNSEMRQLLAQLSESEKELSLKNESLKELNEIALQFVDNVSHEFRTPLTVIKEFVSLMADGVVGEVDDEQKRLLRTVEDRADDLNNMVNDMLDVSKLSAGSIAVSRKKHALKDIVHRVTPSLQRKASLRKVSLEFEIPEDLPDLFCDGEKVGRILINLVVNGIKFCGEPGRVRISARYNKPRGDVEVSVADNGNGIPTDKLDRIFERFSQVRTEFHSQSTKGFGLGLNIVKELVDLNFGEINVVSNPSDGSDFFFTIPCDQPQRLINKFLMAAGRRGNRTFNVFTANLHQPENDRQIADTDALLDEHVKADELVYKFSQNQWLLIVPEKDLAISEYISRFEDLRKLISRNRPSGPLAEVKLEAIGNFEVAGKKDLGSLPEVLQELLQASCSAGKSPISVIDCPPENVMHEKVLSE